MTNPYLSLIVNTFFYGSNLKQTELDSRTVPGFTNVPVGVHKGFNLESAELFIFAPVDPYFNLYANIPVTEERDGVGGSLFRYFLPARRPAGQGREVQERLRPHQRPASPCMGFRRRTAQLPGVHGDGRHGRGKRDPGDLAPGSSRLPSTGSRSAARRERSTVRRRRERRPPCVHGLRENLDGDRGERDDPLRPLLRQGKSEHPDGGRQHDVHRGYRSLRL